MKSFFSLSIFTMMDLMEGSHSMRTPGVQCVSRCLFLQRKLQDHGAGVLGWFLGDKVAGTSYCAWHVVRCRWMQRSIFVCARWTCLWTF
jgi:hypothetical protein